MKPAANPLSQTMPGSSAPDVTSQHMARLIQKLRWARMEHEAQQLELVMTSVPSELRGTVTGGPACTD